MIDSNLFEIDVPIIQREEFATESQVEPTENDQGTWFKRGADG